MENQEPNSQQFQTVRKQQRKSMGYLFMPLIINFAISFVIQIIFCIVIYIGVFADYMVETPEFSSAIMSLEEEETDASELMDSALIDDAISNLTDDMTQVLDANLVLLTVISALATMPAFLWMMRRDRRKFTASGIKKIEKEKLWKYIFIIVGSIAFCVALNNLLTLSQLAEISQAYQETSEEFYSVSYAMQIIGLGMIVPIAEELLFRGVLYNRIKTITKPFSAMIWSALVFAMYHGNLVQLIYAGLCGVMLAWIYEKYGSIKAPILAHICLNLTSIVLTQYELFVWIFEDFIRMTTITVFGSALAATTYVLIQNNTKKNLETI